MQLIPGESELNTILLNLLQTFLKRISSKVDASDKMGNFKNNKINLNKFVSDKCDYHNSRVRSLTAHFLG